MLPIKNVSDQLTTYKLRRVMTNETIMTFHSVTARHRSANEWKQVKKYSKLKVESQRKFQIQVSSLFNSKISQIQKHIYSTSNIK